MENDHKNSYEWGILNFLRTHSLISVRGLELAAKIPKDTIRNALELKRSLPEKHFNRIEEILKEYGYVRVWGVPIVASINTTQKKEKLKQLFTFEGKPYALSYQYRQSSSGYKEDLPALREMIKEGTVREHSKDKKQITFEYIGTV